MGAVTMPQYRISTPSARFTPGCGFSKSLDQILIDTLGIFVSPFALRHPISRTVSLPFQEWSASIRSRWWNFPRFAYKTMRADDTMKDPPHQVNAVESTLGRKRPAAMVALRPERLAQQAKDAVPRGEHLRTFMFADQAPIDVERGQTLVVPAASGGWAVDGHARLLVCRPGTTWPPNTEHQEGAA